MDERSIERRSGPDTIMLLQEIQKVALIAAQTSTDVGLLRADFAEVKKTSCTDADVDKKINDKITENRRWNIGTLVASLAAAAGIGALFKGG
jgi:hypothetical protein